MFGSSFRISRSLNLSSRSSSFISFGMALERSLALTSWINRIGLVLLSC